MWEIGLKGPPPRVAMDPGHRGNMLILTNGGPQQWQLEEQAQQTKPWPHFNQRAHPTPIRSAPPPPNEHTQQASPNRRGVAVTNMYQTSGTPFAASWQGCSLQLTEQEGMYLVCPQRVPQGN